MFSPDASRDTENRFRIADTSPVAHARASRDLDGSEGVPTRLAAPELLVVAAMLSRPMVRLMYAASLTLVASSAAAQPVVYRLVDLGPADAVQSFSTGINDEGVAVGWVVAPGHQQRPVRSMNDLFAIVPGLDTDALALAINVNGDLAGSITISPWPALTYHAMRFTDAGGVEDLGTISGGQAEATSINRFGQTAGWSSAPGGWHAFVSGPGGRRDLGTLGGATSVANGINDAGTVVGSAQVPDGSQQAFIFTPAAGMRSLGIPNSGARAINNRDQVAGSFVSAARYSRAFRYTPGVGLQSLDPMEFRHSSAYAINDRGDVVGTFSPSGSVYPHAFVYSDAEGFVDLNGRIVSGGEGWLVTRGTGINSAGDIVAQAVFGGKSFERAVKMIPVDLIAPVIESATASPATIWPPDGRMVAVALSATVTDNADPAPRCAVTSVEVLHAAFGSGDVVITGDMSLLVRAERVGTSRAGRTYVATVGCADVSGNRSAADVSVRVPHDSRDQP